MGNGVAWIDFDHDGWFDIAFPNGSNLSKVMGLDTPTDDPPQSVNDKLFRNVGGQFEEAEMAIPNEAFFGHGVSVGDYDADGFDDLFFANYGQNYLLHNNGDGTFSKIDSPVIDGDKDWSTATLWVDVDRDGDLDLLVVNYILWNEKNHRDCIYQNILGYCGPGNFEATTDKLYMNNGDGSFSLDDRFSLTGKTKGLCAIAADFDDDRIAEIYIGSDLDKNTLYKLSDSDAGDEKSLVEIASDSGIALGGNGAAEASMGITVHDFCGDEHYEIFLSHYIQMKNTLYENLGDLQFEDVSRRTRIAVTSTRFLGFGTFAIDYDLNGIDDLFVVNGPVLGKKELQDELTPQLLWNNGKGVFYDISKNAGEFFQRPRVGRGAAKSDFDNDGDLDFCTTYMNHPSTLIENRIDNDNRFVSLYLLHPQRRDLTGTKIRVECGDQNRVIPVVSGGSYISINDPRIAFGAGQAKTLDKLTIEWATGEVDVWKDVDTDRFYTLMPNRDPVPQFADH